MTERTRREACRRVGQDGHTVAAVAADLGVGCATVMAAVREYGRPLVDDPDRLAGVHTLGVDETAFLSATPTAGTVFATGIVALNGRARLLDVVEGRSGTVLSGRKGDQLFGIRRLLQDCGVAWQTPPTTPIRGRLPRLAVTIVDGRSH